MAMHGVVPRLLLSGGVLAGLVAALFLPTGALAQMGGGMGSDGGACGMMSGLMWVMPLGLLLVLVLLVLGIAALLKYLFTRRRDAAGRPAPADPGR